MSKNEKETWFHPANPFCAYKNRLHVGSLFLLGFILLVFGGLSIIILAPGPYRFIGIALPFFGALLVPIGSVVWEGKLSCQLEDKLYWEKEGLS